MHTANLLGDWGSILESHVCDMIERKEKKPPELSFFES